ncbi:VanZ family protein [Streptomyces sp. NPDC004838]
MQRLGKGGSAVISFRAAGVILVVAHLLLVGWLALRPLDVPWVTAANLRLFAGIKADLELGGLEAARRIGEGLLLLAPLGVLLPMAGGKVAVSPLASLARTVATGAMISLGIELLQTGVPGRVLDVDSLVLNTAGVAIAHLLVVPVCRARLRRRGPRTPAVRTAVVGRGAETARRGPVPAEESAQGSTPTIPRVGIAP